MEPPEPSADEVTRYLDLLYDMAPDDAQLVVSRPNPRDTRKKPGMLSTWTRVGDRHTLIDTMVDGSRQANVYVNVALRHPAIQGRSNIRGTEADVWVLPGLWADFDHAGGVHTATDLPTRDELLTFLRSLPFQWSLIVDSGGGFHTYLLFREPWVLENAAERTLAQALLRDFHVTLQTWCAQRGWHLDNISNLSWVLRPAGTMNHKNGMVRRVAIVHEADIRVNPSDVAEAPWLITDRSPHQSNAPTDGEWPVADVEPILAGCAWLRHCRDEATTLPEPEWYAMLSILGRCEDGIRLAHAWSRPYPKYDPGETDQKFSHAMGKGPRTCQNIAYETKGQFCGQCPSWQKIRSPMALWWQSRNGQPAGDDPEEPLEPPPADTVLPFPTEKLPWPVTCLVEQAAAALPAPADLVAVPILGVMGAAIGDSHILEIKEGWQESASTYSAVVADPGSKKSPALAIARGPLDVIQHELWRTYQQELKDHEGKVATHEIAMAAWQKKLKDGTAVASQKPPLDPAPTPQQCYTTDATVEAFCEVLSQNPRGMLFLRDELTAWALAMNQYKGGHGSDRQHWLSFWSRAPVTINRKGKKPLFISRPFVCVAGCLPPDVLSDLEDERGRHEGFLDRILWSMPDPVPATLSEQVIEASVKEGYLTLVQQLRALKGVTINGEEVPVVLRLTPETWSLFREMHETVVAETQRPDFLPALKGPWAKMPGHCARLALILHLARKACRETASDDVDAGSMAAAVALIDYFRSHARRVYRHLHATKEDKQVEGVVKWIQAQGGQTKARDIQMHRVGGTRSASEAKALLAMLVDRGYGKLTPGPRKSVIFELISG